jgi:hypothetical protein
VVVQGTETADQKRRTYKELLKQLNKVGVAGEAVAIRKLGSSNMMLTIEDEQALSIVVVLQPLRPVHYLSSIGS